MVTWPAFQGHLLQHFRDQSVSDPVTFRSFPQTSVCVTFCGKEKDKWEFSFLDSKPQFIRTLSHLSLSCRSDAALHSARHWHVALDHWITRPDPKMLPWYIDCTAKGSVIIPWQFIRSLGFVPVASAGMQILAGSQIKRLCEWRGLEATMETPGACRNGKDY